MAIDEVKKVCVVGGGFMGCVVALRCAARGGYQVMVYDLSEQVVEQAPGRLREYAPLIVGMGLLTQQELEGGLERIRFTTDPAAAAADADLLSESVPEIIEVKRATHARFDALLPPRAIQTTNTSYLPVSNLEDAVKRGDRFAALHFHGAGGSVVDIMRGPRTSDETVRILVRFARSIGEIPNVMKKERGGYIYNNLLGALLCSALSLAADGCAEPDEIDRIYMLLSGQPHGPFGIMDAVGLDVVHDNQQYFVEPRQVVTQAQIAEYLRTFIERGALGLKTGTGFYSYPDPAFQRPGFLQAIPSH